MAQIRRDVPDQGRFVSKIGYFHKVDAGYLPAVQFVLMETR